MRRSSSRRRVHLALLWCSLKFPNKIHDTFYKISFIKCVVNWVHSYRWRRWLALYLDNALVWRKARTSWEYNELILTDHGARISLIINNNVCSWMALIEIVLCDYSRVLNKMIFNVAKGAIKLFFWYCSPHIFLLFHMFWPK